MLKDNYCLSNHVFFRNFEPQIEKSKMDKKVIKHILLLDFVSSGLLYITRSWLMSLGIMMILLLIDALLRQYDNKRRQKWLAEQRKKMEESDEEQDQP